MNKIYIFLIIIITLLFWKPILDLIPMGEGYYYFDRCQNQFLAPSGCQTSVWQYDNLARIIFQILIPVLGDNINLYPVAQMIMMIFLYLTLYFVLSGVTKDNFFGFIVTVLFITNYTGSFSMVATGNYQRFVQRVPNLIPIFISFYYLYKYFEKHIFKYLITAIALLIVSIFLSHHSIFMVPLFIVYLLIKTTRKSLVLNLVTISFVGIASLLLTRSDHLKPSAGIISYVKNTPQLFEKTYLQITNQFVPTEIVKYVAKNWPDTPASFPFTKALNLFTIPVVLLLIIPLLLNKNKARISELYKVSIFTLPIVCFLNLYAYGDGAPHPLKNIGEDRIYFISSIFTSIIFGTYFYYGSKAKNTILKLITITLFATYILYNSKLTNLGIKNLESNSDKMRTVITYVKQKTLDKDTKVLIIGHSSLLWPNQFMDHFYNTNNNLTIELDSSDWKETIKNKDFGRIFKIDYINNKLVDEIIK